MLEIERSKGDAGALPDKEALKVLAFNYLPMEIPEPYNRRKGVSSDRIGYVNGGMPIFNGPDQDKPWVKELHRYVHWQ